MRLGAKHRRRLVAAALVSLLVGIGAAALLYAKREAVWSACRDLPAYDAALIDVKALGNVSLTHPTTLQFGPDGRLYVAQADGFIHAFVVERTWAGAFRVVEAERIDLIRQIPNHNDDGSVNTGVEDRLITGIVLAGTAERPEIYVASSDPRIRNPDTDTNSGVVSRLVREGEGWVRLDLVVGLPRSKSDHATNGLQLDRERNVLYVCQGGNTNQGAPSKYFASLPEYALSAAVLEIDLERIGEQPYVLPTLDDEDRPGVEDENDPFGGNGGKNQAVLEADGPVQVYASGFRNPYDLALTERGLYVIDNGPNPGFGGVPETDAASGKATNRAVEGGQHLPDNLHRIGRGYYAGHPNPTRANRENRFNGSNPQSPVVVEDPRESRYLTPGEEDGAITTFKGSTNGIAEYNSPALGEAYEGSLLLVSFDNKVHRVRLDAEGSRLVERSWLVDNLGGIPLDITVAREEHPFPGSLWVADYATGEIWIVEPRSGQSALGGRVDALMDKLMQRGCSRLMRED